MGNKWESASTAPIEAPSYTALFRVENFKTGRSTDYRIRYQYEDEDVFFYGTIAKGPNTGEAVKIVGLTCYQNISKSADAGWGEGFLRHPRGKMDA